MSTAYATGSETRPLRCSFRDPAGFVYASDGVVYRQVNAVYRREYDRLMTSGLYETLVDQGLLVAHSELRASAVSAADTYRILRPEQIPFISYPYEWCFSALRDAALTTLAVERAALDRGMSLKDASAYNIQFRGAQPVFIDTLSFETYEEGRPWRAYRQFCQHFLAPLALMSTVDAQLGQLLRVHLDGIPLEIASRLLPMRSYLSPAMIVHLHAHARAQKRFAADVPVRASRHISRFARLGLLDSLRRCIEGLRWTRQDTTWADYDQQTNYSADARASKEEIVTRFLRGLMPRAVWDLGANGGRFSRIAADTGALTISFDSDMGATEFNYTTCRRARQSRILPLLLDLTNPSPALGWSHEERDAWTARGPVDAILALAVVHHLAIGNNVPLDRIAELFCGLARHVIVEFVPKADSQVKRLLATRDDIYVDYSRSGFEHAFSAYFRIQRIERVRDSERVVYLMERRRS